LRVGLLGPKLPCAARGADAGALAGAAAGLGVVVAPRVLAVVGRLGGVWADAGRFQAMAVVMTTAAAVRASCLAMSRFLSVG